MNDDPEIPNLADRLADIASAHQRPAEVRQAINAALAAIEEQGLVPGIPVGGLAPDFSLPNAVGETVRLADRLTEGPVVLSFYRGSWCPYCNAELHAYQEALPAFRREGAHVIAVSPQAPDDSISLTEKHNLKFDVLSDVHQRVIGAYRIRYVFPESVKPHLLKGTVAALARQQPDGRWSLPAPATFVLDPQGVVRARHVSMAYRTRMEPAAALRVVRDIRSGKAERRRADG
ncbi:peroxiredoxin family protein [Streptomyces sp. NPDC085932]|uniref:peroxiredoxin family protein n=1 Tax=Streptomyces sp. NPDC085932 TaxID=3365741 RepID=UPI0037D6C083